MTFTNKMKKINNVLCFIFLLLYLSANFKSMQYIGNIVTKNKIDVSEFLLVTDDISSVNMGIPTIIVGWSLVKELFPDQDILNKQINENITWTFSKREKRYKYEQDIEDFVKMCIKRMLENINYKFFNYLVASPEKRKNFVNFVNRGGCYMYYNARFLYVYSPNSKMTIGLSLTDLRYAGIKIKSFLSMLNIEDNNFIANNLDFLSNDSLILLKDNVKVAAYLNYLKNSDIYI